MKKRLLFVITQFYKGGAETSLLNLFYTLDPMRYDVDFLILNQLEYQDATSLIELVPAWIHIYDVVKESKKRQFAEQIVKKIYRRIFHAETYGLSAMQAIKGKTYDVAFSFGEWLSPEFVADKVEAKKKYVWVHIDLDKADFVNKEELFKYDDKISKYIFVSKKSRQGAIKCWPRIENKTAIIHNFLNVKGILEKAAKQIDKRYEDTPYLLSVGNLREEKNYPRQVDVMHLLKEKGISAKWLCIGSTVNEKVYREVQEKIKGYQLEEDFILCGADENPYRYMKRARAVMVLSDHESWSLVISEAKILGTPVIATKTSGALEQILDRKTGILVDFSSQSIADDIELFLKDRQLQQTIRSNLELEKYNTVGIKEFENLVSESE